jgi:hypothetical protein
MANGTQTHFRFRNDNGSETTATWIAAVDTNISMTMQDVFRLRIAYTSGYSALTGWDLYYSYNAGSYTAVTNGSVIQVVSSSQGAGLNGTATTQLNVSLKIATENLMLLKDIYIIFVPLSVLVTLDILM